MNISGKAILALSACHVAGCASAFLVPSSKARTAAGATALHLQYRDEPGGVGLMERTMGPPPNIAPPERGTADLARYDRAPPPGPLRERGMMAQPRRRAGPSEMSNLMRTDADRYPRSGGQPGQEWWNRESPGFGRTIQGNSRSTVGVGDRAEVFLQTEGRPLDTEIELYDGPNNTPTKIKVYSEDGRLRPFRAMVNNPSRSGMGSISLRNSASMEFPVRASVATGAADSGRPGFARASPMGAADSSRPGFANSGGFSSYRPLTSIQGGSLKTWSLDASVGSAEVTIETDGLPMYATVELWGCGGHVKQLAEIYNDDGYARPFSAIVETPGGANTICVKNNGPMEYPMKATVEPASTESFNSYPYDGNYGGNAYGGYSPYELPYSNGAPYAYDGSRPYDSSYYNSYNNNRVFQY